MKRILLVMLLISSIQLTSVAQKSIPSAATTKTDKDTTILQKQIKVAPKVIDWHAQIDSADVSWERTKNDGRWNEKHKSYICEQHDKTNTCRDSLICQLELQNKLLKDTLSMFTFFNNSEVSLFLDSTLIKNGMDKQLKGDYQVRYKTIRLIADLNQQLLKVDKIIAENKNQQKEKGWNNNQLNNAIRLDISKTMTEIGQSLDQIDKRNRSWLSKTQKEYYKQLSKKFDTLYYTYF